MNDVLKSIDEIVGSYLLPGLGVTVNDIGGQWKTENSAGGYKIGITLDAPLDGIKPLIADELKALIMTVSGVDGIDITLHAFIQVHIPCGKNSPIPGVKNIIAVASGKGGVGKSTTSVNLALALTKEGAKVGILDADIYGPSIPMMLGIDDGVRPEQVDGKYFRPIISHGVQSLSMGNLVTEKTPIVWRGPKASGALLQLFQNTIWNDLDYLIVDLPPGTGDIQLTLAQNIPVTGAVIVTTPQDIALLDAQKAIEMFNKVNVPVLGVVENMSVHTCSACGHSEHIFGEEGGARIAQTYDSVLLGTLPLALSIREHVDGGNPSVVADPEGAVAMEYRCVARRVAVNLALMEKSSVIPVVS
ncbi:MAG: iron-sulfur cluster carrier protein ApbC [Gammaproteobacteria bacterium]|nr:iron-sulfur cluster carrier protein ApbC [Gammaproteobacteria bacterium]